MPSAKVAGNAPADHPPVATGRVGVLLVNLGTPEATSYWPMRAYLKQFLSDRRVIETNRALWWFILNGIILTSRPRKSGHAYEQIWNRERDESPLKTITRSQAEKLAERFKSDDAIMVRWAMRYGQPAVGDVLEDMKVQGCERILVMALYPQYSAATTASVMDAVCERLQKMRWQPAIRTLPAYYDHDAYIDALAATTRAWLDKLDFKPQRIVASFHGLPEAYVAKGDPYYCHCQKTARLLRAKLGMGEGELIVTFQSRFGRAEWLKPYTAETITELARSGVTDVAVITPGFAADCVETLEEIAIGAGNDFKQAGGVNFAVAPCLNDQPAGIDLLESLARQETAGWIG